MSDSTENPAEEETDGPGFPHTPPLGIKAVRPGGDPNPNRPPDDLEQFRPRPERPAGNWLGRLSH